MKTLGNILWVLLFGWEGAAMWLFVGILWCITIVGIPIGKQCFKFAGVSFLPFKKEITYGKHSESFIANLLWILFGGFEMAVANLVAGAFCCMTIVGIPFGMQFFKLARLSISPFGARIVEE